MPDHEAPPGVKRLAEILFGSFDPVAWEKTRWNAFASHASINELRRQYGQQELSVEEYEVSKTAYYERHPTAGR